MQRTVLRLVRLVGLAKWQAPRYFGGGLKKGERLSLKISQILPAVKSR